MASRSDIQAGRAYVELTVRNSQLLRGLAAARKQLDEFSRATMAVGTPLVAAGTAAAGVLGLAVKAASDATETVNKFGAVFGTQAEAAGRFADALAEGLGRSKYQVRDAMAAFQAFFVGMAFDPAQARQMSEQLEALAIDFGSFYNVSDTEAMERFISAMSGSSEVLDKFGINIKQAALEAELLRMGVDKAWSEVSEAEKVQARFNIILNTMRAQGAVGDAAKTAGSFENQMKVLASKVQEAAVAVGSALIPVLTPLVGLLADNAANLAAWAAANSEAIVTVAKVAAGVTAAGAALVAFGSVASGISAVLGLVSTAVTGLSAALAFLAANPIGLAVAAASAAALAFLYFSGALDKVRDGIANLLPDFVSLGEAASRSADALRSEQAALDHKARRLAELRGKQQASNTEMAEAATLASELEAKYPALAGEIAGLGTSAEATQGALEAMGQAMVQEQIARLQDDLARSTAEAARLTDEAQKAKAALDQQPTRYGMHAYGAAMASAHQSRDEEALQAEADRLPALTAQLEAAEAKAEQTRRLIDELAQIGVPQQRGFFAGLTRAAAGAGRDIGIKLWEGITSAAEASRQAAEKFLPDLRRARIEAIADDERRDVERLKLEYEARIREAQAENLPTGLVEQTRDQEIANVRARYAQQRAERQLGLEDQIAAAEIDASDRSALDKELARIELARKQALREAGEQGLDPSRVNRLYDLQADSARQRDEMDQRIGVAGAFSGYQAALFGGTAGPQERTAKASEKTAKGIDKTNKLLEDLPGKMAGGLAIA